MGFQLKFTVLLFASFFVLDNGFAQSKGRVEVIKDAQIDSLISRRIAMSSSVEGSGSAAYRVQIYSGSERQDAFDAQNRFKSLNPSITTYLSYIEPNYRVQAGNFRTRLEAQNFTMSLKQTFPASIIVPAKPNLSQ